MKKVWLMVLVVILVYTAVDILIWQKIFEEQGRYLGQLNNEIVYYHFAWQTLLFGMTLLGFISLWPNKKLAILFALATISIAHSGLEDILYYLLSGNWLPSELPWLDDAPLILGQRPIEPRDLLLSSFVCLSFWFLMSWGLSKENKSASES